jgi:hypothetical protein
MTRSTVADCFIPSRQRWGRPDLEVDRRFTFFLA